MMQTGGRVSVEEFFLPFYNLKWRRESNSSGKDLAFKHRMKAQLFY
jgi:hypothetical protein